MRARAGIANPAAHGFSEILYALTSAANNNGSAFAGLSANTPFYNVLLGLAVWLGRFGVIVPVLAIAGSFGRQETPARHTRNLAHPRPAVCRVVDWHCVAGGVVELCTRSGPGAYGRAPDAVASPLNRTELNLL
jgi:K+-transporting ATPase A subunit